MIKNIFLDFDGTLVDIKERHHTVYTLCVKAFGGIPLNIDTYWDLKRRDTLWSDIIIRSKLSLDIEKDFLALFVEYIEDIEMLKKDRLFGDALAFIDHVAQDYNVYLVSLRRHHDHLMEQLEYLSIEHRFTAVLSGHSETKRGVLTKKAEVIRGVDGYSEGIIIGDTEADIVAGTHLNILSIALTTGIRDISLLQKLQPTYVANSLTEARQYISR